MNEKVKEPRPEDSVLYGYYDAAIMASLAGVPLEISVQKLFIITQLLD